ncbi:MAG: SIS domain-containing protein [Mycobacteriales bacterium]
MNTALDESVLDSADRLAAADRDGLLRALATAGAQIRESLARTGEADVAVHLGGVRPRAVLLAADPLADDAAALLTALAGGPEAAAPMVRHDGPALPAWAGATDAVLAVTQSPTAAAVPALADAAARRGLTVLGVGADESTLHEACGRNRVPFVALPAGRLPRAALWGLLAPLLVAAGELGLLPRTGEDLARTADLLDELAERVRPSSETYGNPAKSLALDLAESQPVLVGTSAAAGAVARRLAGQLAESGRPAPWGTLPAAATRLGGLLTGSDIASDDLFRDRAEEPGPARPRLVLIRDGGEADHMQALADQLVADCGRRGVGVSEVAAEQGAGPVGRLGSLIGLLDFAAAYLGLAAGTGPDQEET